jgi:hypothetical protein
VKLCENCILTDHRNHSFLTINESTEIMKKEVLEKEGKELTKLNKESRNTITENTKNVNTSYNVIISKLKIVIKDFMAENVKKIGSLEEMNSTIIENIALENVLLSNLKSETDPNSIQFHKEILEKEIHKIEESKKRIQNTFRREKILQRS